jgi:hypothetical protein
MLKLSRMVFCFFGLSAGLAAGFTDGLVFTLTLGATFGAAFDKTDFAARFFVADFLATGLLVTGLAAGAFAAGLAASLLEGATFLALIVIVFLFKYELAESPLTTVYTVYYFFERRFRRSSLAPLRHTSNRPNIISKQCRGAKRGVDLFTGRREGATMRPLRKHPED